MVLPGSDNSLSFSQIQTEFGGENPISLSEYYRGGGIVTDVAARSAVNSGRSFVIGGASGPATYTTTSNVNGANSSHGGWTGNSGGYTTGQWGKFYLINYRTNAFTVGSNNNKSLTWSLTTNHAGGYGSSNQHYGGHRIYCVTDDARTHTSGINPSGWQHYPSYHGATRWATLSNTGNVYNTSGGPGSIWYWSVSSSGTVALASSSEGQDWTGYTSCRLWVYVWTWGKAANNPTHGDGAYASASAGAPSFSWTSTTTNTVSYSNPTWSYSEANGQSASGSVSHNYDATQMASQIRTGIGGVSGLSSGGSGTTVTVDHETTNNNTGTASVSNSGTGGSLSVGSESHITGQTQHNGTQSIPTGSAEAGNPITMSNFYDMQGGS